MKKIAEVQHGELWSSATHGVLFRDQRNRWHELIDSMAGTKNARPALADELEKDRAAVLVPPKEAKK